MTTNPRSGGPRTCECPACLSPRRHSAICLLYRATRSYLRRLQEAYPERTLVGTGNDETNLWMVDINERLGFHLVELCRMYRKVLPA